MGPRWMHVHEKLRKRNRAKNDEGFTILEVMIAISILAVGLLALASMQISSIRGNSFASGVTEGTSLAADRIEKLITLPYNHPYLTGGNHTDPGPPIGYAIAWNVMDNSPLNDTKTIDITVTWLEHGVPKKVSIQRIVPRME